MSTYSNPRYRLQVGIEPCCGPNPTIAEMRAAILEAAPHSAVINAAIAYAVVNRLNDEERYTVLAYHALVVLEQYYKQVSDLLSRLPLTPGGPVV